MGIYGRKLYLLVRLAGISHINLLQQILKFRDNNSNFF